MCETLSWSHVLQKWQSGSKSPCAHKDVRSPSLQNRRLWNCERERLKSAHTLWPACQNAETESFSGILLNSAGLRKPAVKLLSERPAWWCFASPHRWNCPFDGRPLSSCALREALCFILRGVVITGLAPRRSNGLVTCGRLLWWWWWWGGG